MTTIDIVIMTIGWIAAVVTMVMNAPQTFKVLKTKNADGLPLLSYSILTFGFISFLFWASHLGQKYGMQMFVTNFVGIALVLPLFWFAIKDKKKALVTVSTIAILALTASALFLFELLEGKLDGRTNDFLKVLFPTLAGIGIGLAFFPQTIASISTKSVNGVPILSIILLLASNTLWTIWAIISFIELGDASFAISAIFNTFGIMMQVPLLYLKLRKV